MNRPTLFLGFSPDPQFQTLMQSTNSHLVALLTSGGDYLKKVSHAGNLFLGKEIASTPNFEELENFEIHLLSLLKKLAPDYAFHTNLLKLFPI